MPQFLSEPLEEEALNNELGIDLKFKVNDFVMLDTLYNYQLADSLKLILTESIERINQIGFQKNDFIKFREQELTLRNDRNYYTDFVENHSIDSEWLREIRKIFERTDLVIANYEDANIIELFELYSWYQHRYWSFYDDKANVEKYKYYIEAAKEYKNMEEVINKYMEKPNEIVYFKAKVSFEQINPLLGGAKQKLTKITYFDKNKNLMND